MPSEENTLSRDERRFAEQVRILREENGWTQADLAERMQQQSLAYVTQSTISRIEKATRPVRMMEAQAFAQIFGRSTSLLIHPDSREKFIQIAASNHKHGRGSYVKLKEGAREMAEAQARVSNDLERLEELFGDGSTLHEDSRPILEMLRHNMTRFVAIDPIAETTEIIEAVRKRRVEHSETP
ncbi:helix-turn-helix domain-containing protein [Herbiconiux sp. CPCC 205716]|uniref:Helix-turn-helix domain-containing protein n=1 Tax=Herbiconiux gentiana TaxID=2970912 RepID=A0ABT2GFX1_9MICO|nr:helix-turn-helix transcriptional regulator [Herbiconiux gentiana]MCS5715105.1 helix-turn-helix domain-containing protein [Herbiconiux gentiana]